MASRSRILIFVNGGIYFINLLLLNFLLPLTRSCISTFLFIEFFKTYNLMKDDYILFLFYFSMYENYFRYY